MKSEEIEKIIYKYLPEESIHSIVVIDAMNYAIKAGGKRIRPLLMNLTYKMFGGNELVIEPFMAAIEMIHTYSLIHDDLPALDNDDYRRGLLTVHKKFGEDIAILAGDALLNFAFETASKAFLIKPGDASIEKAFVVLCRKPGINGMIGGQTADICLTGGKMTWEQLEYIYLNKTAALIECAMEIGALLAGVLEETVDKIEEIARLVGMAFQVQDDILDVLGDEKTIGKPVGSDIKNNKYTYTTIYGIEEAKKYVIDASKNALDILNSISEIKDESYKNELNELILALIYRDK